jgi:hypothetical protein
MYDDYEDYYEPSEVDQLVEEFKDKCREYLLPNIREEIDRLNKENSELKSKNNEYKNRESELNKKERDLKYKEDNLKREVEREFYESNIGDTLKDYIENAEVWFADKKGFKQEKCSLCDDERKLVAEFPGGKITKIDCDCSKLVYSYVPEISELSLIKFNKKDSRYQSDRKFYLSKSYTPSKNSRYSDDYCYNEFKLCEVVNEFNDSIKELHEDKKYGTEIGFKSKEECQKYCDWLNENR